MQDLRARLQQAVFGAIDEVNQQRPPGQQIGKTPDSPLAGDARALDSLGLVNFVVALEQRLDEVLAHPISLLDHEQVDLTSEHFRTVGAIVDYLEHLQVEETDV